MPPQGAPDPVQEIMGAMAQMGQMVDQMAQQTQQIEQRLEQKNTQLEQRIAQYEAGQAEVKTKLEMLKEMLKQPPQTGGM
jgi:uncharacterized protein YoxC